LVLGVGAGFTAAWRLSMPYLDYLRGSLVPLLLICAAVLVVAVLGTALAPRLAALRLPSRLPDVVAALVVAATLILAARPWFQTVRRFPDNEYDRRTRDFIEAIQRGTGLPPDGTRLYYEHSLTWVTWYVGLPVVLLATLAAVILARRLTTPVCSGAGRGSQGAGRSAGTAEAPVPTINAGIAGPHEPDQAPGVGAHGAAEADDAIPGTSGADRAEAITSTAVPVNGADDPIIEAGAGDQKSRAEAGVHGADRAVGGGGV
ncbi:hypothetical protein C1I98_39380, partial [Spongiactinospora gelatinilytica]